jgi:hypothetical protein
VYDPILAHIQTKIRRGEYVMTMHAEEEMENDLLSIYDVENAILTGSIVERQIDHRTKDWKYVIDGTTDTGLDLTVVVKVSPIDIVVIITVYLRG